MENNQITENYNNKKLKITKRVKRKTLHLILLLGVTSSVFVVATYAWFIGITTVSVDSFVISIQTVPGIEISLDADTFSDSISVTEATISANNTSSNNHWAGDEGLAAFSSNGVLSSTGHLTFFSKASISASNGGFKLRTELVSNETTEQDGYLTFDIFLRNTTNADTSTLLTYNPADEEGVYLINSSSATMVATGSETGGDGVENTVRIGFYEIARAAYNTEAAVLLSMNCGTSTSNVLSLCRVQDTNTSIGDGRGWNWNIWEPNDTKHTATSISHFSSICKKRTNTTEYTTESCTAFTNNTYVNTYASNRVITAADNVNVYDGLNNYTASTSGTNPALKLVSTYTDTQKSLSAAEKSEIFYLAPNSVTKVRVYVWLEGQDVDNFDIGSIGKKLQINFGFTKDKYSDTTATSS